MSIRDAADSLRQFGPGSKIIISVAAPKESFELSLDGDQLVVSSGNKEIFRVSTETNPPRVIRKGTRDAVDDCIDHCLSHDCTNGSTYCLVYCGKKCGAA